MPKNKSTSVVIEGVEFAQPFKMKKARFTKLYGGRYGDRADAVFEQLTKKK